MTRTIQWALLAICALTLLASPALAKPCTSGDCQQGVMTGPFVAPQVAQFTSTAPFPICQSLLCTSGQWSGLSIEGIDAQQNIGTQYQFYDNMGPNIDPNIAVGPTVSGQNAQVLQWVNAQYLQAFDKVTGQPIFTSQGGTTAIPQTVERLWSATTQPECHTYPSGNVQVIFDRLDNAFVISRRISYIASGIHQYAWCIAASSSSDLSDPTTQWYAYEYQLGSVIPCLPSSNNCTSGSFHYYFPDWPRIGTWTSGFFITFDLQDPTANYVEGGFEACKLDRANIVRGNATNPMTCYSYTVPVTQRPSLIHSVDVADIDSANPPNSGEPEYFLAIVNPSNYQQGLGGKGWCTSQTTVCRSNQLAFLTWGPGGLKGQFLTVNPYTPGCYNTTKGQEANTYCVPEPSTNLSSIGPYGSPDCGNYITSCLDSLGDRMANRLTFNNFSSGSGGPNGEFLTASHVVMESSSNQRTGVRYYVIKITNGNPQVFINSGGSGAPDLQDPNGALWYLMPSAALDLNGNLGFTYTTSGPHCSGCQTQPNPAINFVVLPWGGTTFDSPTLIVQGAGDQESTDRFGEYAATVVDSTDDLTFYGIGEYYNKSETGTSNCQLPASNCYTWQTRIFRGQYGGQF